LTQVSATNHRPVRGVGFAGAALLDLQLRHLPGTHRRCFHFDGGCSRTFSSGTSRGPTVDVFTLVVDALGPSASAPPGGPSSMFSCWCWTLLDLQLRHIPGARRRRFHVDSGCTRTFSSGTSRGSVVDVFTLMVGAPGPSAPAPLVDSSSTFFTLVVGAPGPSAPTPLGGLLSTAE
jgi:hypothetical protein